MLRTLHGNDLYDEYNYKISKSIDCGVMGTVGYGDEEVKNAMAKGWIVH
jgi:surfactin synthase thioesterase subunit